MRNKILMSLGVIFIALAGCQAQQKSDATYKDLSAEEFREQIKVEDAIVLDVRTPGEIAQGKIGEAQEIDFNNSNFSDELSKLPKDKPIYVYCAVGGRSSKTANQLIQKGFTKVYNLDGGIGAWNKNGFELNKK